MRFIVLFCSFIFAVNVGYGQYIEDKDVPKGPRKIVKRFETMTWKTAGVVPRGELHLSLLSPVRWGIGKTVELQSYLPLWGYLTPNIYVKKKWAGERWIFSSKHGLYYPSKGLEFLKDDGENSTLEPYSKIPQIITFQNELILSYVLNPSCNKEEPFWIATARLGTDISLVGERDETFYRMTFFSLYHRTASFYGDNVFYAGLQLDGGLWTQTYFNIGVDAYAVDKEPLAGIEGQLNAIYHYNQRWSFSAGAKVIVTRNPIESETHYFPTIDVCYRFGKKGLLQRGLFGKNR